ncbi:MAG: branched-chain amino acid aminotransferase [Holosporales bacterium]|jgi:branched-chain amino acid aminotransferase|nr:branched-chain amino acid aminotransferase [Holosporales bacterium]
MTNIDQREGFIWINGKFVKWQEAKIHVLTHGLHFGSSVFEGERSYNGKVFKMREHHERLFESAEILDLTPQYTIEEINDIVMETLAQNNLTNAYIRPLIWRGSENLSVFSRDSSINVMVAAWEWKSYFGEDLLKEGVSLCWADWRRPDPRTAPTSAKASGLYMIGTISKNKARDKGFDDVIMTDYRGYIAESSGSNIFFVINDEIHTPAPHAFLNGITRQTIIEISKQKGYKVYSRDILPEELRDFDEVFLTGTAAEVVPVGKIENQVFEIGYITKELRKAYLELVNA